MMNTVKTTRQKLHRIASGDTDVFFDSDALDILVPASTVLAYSVVGAEQPADVHSDVHPRWESANQSTSSCPSTETAAVDKLVLLTTQECNLRCRYCFAQDSYLCASSARVSSAMSPDTAEAAIRGFMKATGGRITTILFFGGEPLLNSECIYRCVALAEHLAKSLDTPCPQFALVTNGTLVKPKFADFLGEHNFAVTLSLDGPREVHDTQRIFSDGSGSYADVIRSLAILKQSVRNLVCQATYTKEHVEQHYTPLMTAQALQNIGINRLHMLPAIGQAGPLRIPREDSQRVRSGFRELCEFSVKSLATERPLILDQAMNILNAILLRKRRRFICTAGIDTFTVDAIGDVYPCYMMNTDDCRMGNVLDAEFPGPLFQSVRSRFQGLDRSQMRKCSGCFARNICYSCYGDGFLTSGQPTSPSHMFCSFLRGVAEGTISGLAHLRMNATAWEAFLSNCATGFCPIGSQAQRSDTAAAAGE